MIARTPITCLIVEDEPHGQEILIKFISKFPDLSLVGVASNAREANQLYHEQRPELLFLDMKLPGASGVDLVRLLPEPLPMVVAVTAFKDRAADFYDHGIKTALVDYVTKPLDFDRFATAIQRVRDQVDQHTEKARYLDTLPDNEPPPTDTIMVKVGRDRLLFPFKDIHYFEADENYVKVFLLPALKLKPVRTRRKISDLELELPPAQFTRISRGFIVRRELIYSVSKQDVHLSTGLSFTVGIQYRDALLNQFTKNGISH